MRSTNISRLGYALLGLLQQRPFSGYDLRKMFSSTAIKTYSDSPGAIYPALRRLAQQGLIRGSVEARAGLRRRQVFRLTPQGRSELRKWITRPVTQEDLLWGQGETLLRFGFAESAAGRAAAARLLHSLEAALRAYLPSLHAQLNSMKTRMPLSARLAFECGIRGYECLLEWTHYAIATYKKEGKGEGS